MVLPDPIMMQPDGECVIEDKALIECDQQAIDQLESVLP
jgi:hypothetical protein